MIRIRFDRPASALIAFAPGDELTVATLTPDLQSLLASQQLDGKHLARVITSTDEIPEFAAAAAAGHETAVTDPKEEITHVSSAGEETAATKTGRKHGSRRAPVSE